MDDRPYILWTIYVYDRMAEERLPLKTKHYVFSYDRATEEQAKEVIRLCFEEESSSRPVPEKANNTVTFSIGGMDSPNPLILKYRILFDYVPDLASSDHCKRPTHSKSRDFILPFETYIEDEKEQPITLTQALDEEARRKHGRDVFAIVMDHPESVLRCCPADPIRPKCWQASDLVTIDHCLRQFQSIVRSRWFSSKCEIASIGDKTIHASLPLPEDCMAVVIPFRQLYSQNSSDDLFNKVCNIHNRHCPKGHPAFGWVKHYQRYFNVTLDKEVDFPLSGCKLTQRRYLNAFAYGAKIIHANSQDEQPIKDFHYLKENFQKEMFVWQYHMLLRYLMYPVSMVTGVLQQNVGHWVNDLGWETEPGLGGSDVFGH